jgi:hypothetical protein
VLVAVPGDFTGNNDALWAVQLSSGHATKVADGDAPFVFGSVAFIAARHEALLTDGSVTMPMVRSFDVSHPDAIAGGGGFAANPGHGLPPQHIGWY